MNAGKSTLLKILVGEEEPTSGEINKKKDISLSYLAQDSRFESENTIYDEMLHVFDDLRRTETQLRQMELEMGEKSGESLDKLMIMIVCQKIFAKQVASPTKQTFERF